MEMCLVGDLCQLISILDFFLKIIGLEDKKVRANTVAIKIFNRNLGFSFVTMLHLELLNNLLITNNFTEGWHRRFTFLIGNNLFY